MEDGLSFASCVRLLAEERPDDPVYWHVPVDGPDRVFSWRDLERWSRGLAAALAERGLGVGDRLAIGLRNSPEFVVSTLAAWRLGAMPIPVRWDVPDWEHERVREVIAARVDLGTDDIVWIDASAEVSAPELPDVVSPHVNGICSSGSTGLPKVIVSTRPGVVDMRLTTPMAAAWGPVSAPQTVLVLAPMYHTNGFSTLFSLLAGDRLVVMEKFDAVQALDIIERHRITTFTATPTMLKRIADVPDVESRDLSSIEWILQGAAPMPPTLVHWWAGLVGAERIFMAYGMTEGLGFAVIRGDEWMSHPGSVGRSYRETEMRILDAEGNELPVGEIGEVYLRSPMKIGYDYLGGAPLLPGTADGFETAGDMGRLDDDGYLYIIDRRVDMIITGGANVFPAEVEAALIDHPAIADVVVIGLRDEEWGRRVHAVIEPKDPAAPPTRDDVVAFAKSRLAPYKVPKTIEIVDAMPRSEATKVNRGALVEARGE